MKLAKETKNEYKSEELENGETCKQLLARSRYLLFKSEEKWTLNHIQRAVVLFKWYPDIKIAYYLTMSLRHIYHTVRDKRIAFTRLAKWYEDVEQSGFKQFNTVKKSIAAHYQYIIIYFDNRSTNASAESFNAKIKALALYSEGSNIFPISCLD
jgi:transposase